MRGKVRVKLVKGFLLSLSLMGLGVVLTGESGCLTRPVTRQEPTTKVNFTAAVKQQSVDKVDILFVIDNSASMGDKQAYLSLAVPDLIGRLILPNCISLSDNKTIVPRMAGQPCPSGSKEEFPPVHDMHIGVITSSLGPRGGSACQPAMTMFGNDAHNDDKGELINRSFNGMTEGAVTDANPSGFLNWFPTTAPANQGKMVVNNCVTGSNGCPPALGAVMGGGMGSDPTQFEKDFTDVISGVQEHGCGLESQLEAWYRFLVQPDPYGKITGGTAGGAADWADIDTTILKQRHDFLRPDSLVAIIDMTDEDDSEMNVRAFGGQGWKFLDANFAPPRGTVACGNDPTDPNCTSCGFNGNPNDANCMMGAYTGLDPRNNLNLRHLHMKANYGIDPQYPIERYLHGLECGHANDADPTDRCYAGKDVYGAGGPVGLRHGYDTTPYVGIRDRMGNECVNPIYAQSLPDGTNTDPGALCNLTRGLRTPDLVFYAHIGGVPWELLHFTPNNPSASALSDADWTRILGKGYADWAPGTPFKFDYSGIDIHMVESTSPRMTTSINDNSLTNNVDPPPATNSDGNDKVSGHEWNTSSDPSGADREYACIFKLPQMLVKDCTMGDAKTICDCPTDPTKIPTPDKLPPLCNPATPTQQNKAKAYPTIRELWLARLVGQNGIVSSLCPVTGHETEQGTGDPLFGYRPAVSAIVDRLKNALANQCLPRPLAPDQSGQVPCLILETLPTKGNESACGPPVNAATGNCPTNPVPKNGLCQPDPNILTLFRQQQEAAWNAAGGPKSGLDDPALYPVCQVSQLGPKDLMNGSCEASGNAGWCYVTGSAAGQCSQAILFSNAGNPPPGAQVSLQCIETAGGIVGTPDGG